ncbi:GNAT family N-acetyltransferase [Bradyrhizobium japonicum]|uniref:GNAT family N-acetyltransferase n=1 Tax=Bradyrhizobium japonicum TaxID=375 RepID=UPI001BA4BA24|nr:GNAT family N-acetyltransferase [Bradyrhizobium japonicum]MBR0962060.1 GNAT family N-acetyltransferase [Bradyrhizobium japonicum]
MTIISLERTADTLPADFPELEADAKADGHAHMTRLVAEFAQDRAMFHAIFTCRLDRRLVGIGAITNEPAPASVPIPMWRMRRLYVHQDYRRRKVAGAIANALLREAAGMVSTVTVHAGNAGAARFWEAMGFTRVDGQPWSHEARLPILGPAGGS